MAGIDKLTFHSMGSHAEYDEAMTMLRKVCITKYSSFLLIRSLSVTRKRRSRPFFVVYSSKATLGAVGTLPRTTRVAVRLIIVIIIFSIQLLASIQNERVMF